MSVQDLWGVNAVSGTKRHGITPHKTWILSYDITAQETMVLEN
jgi:hypothetical protein